MRALIYFFLILFTGVASAHHGSNGQFNHDIKVEVTGILTDVKLVNPHSYVYFDVVGENGETQEWRCEMHAMRELRKNGWTEDMFVKGSEVTLRGSQARREEFGCYMDSISFAGGPPLDRNGVVALIEDEPIPEVELAEGTPVFNGRWQSLIPHGGARRSFVMPEAAIAAQEAAWPNDMPTGQTSYVQSEAGKLASSGFTSEMNPRFHCQATNLFHDWTFVRAVNVIDQSDDKIVIRYGFMDIVRTIHLDMDAHPEDIQPSRAGHSIGKWEGDTLVVDTIGFAEGWLEASRQGIKHSDQMHVVERFNLAGDDNEWLLMTYTVNDPLYLAEPYTAQIMQERTGEPYADYECLELTEERVEGF